MKRSNLLFVVLAIFLVIGVFLVGCNNAPSGKLSIKQTGSNTIDVNYSFSNCGKVAFAPGEYVGSGSGSGVKQFDNLQPDKSYTFQLWNNGSELLATVTGKTSNMP